MRRRAKPADPYPTVAKIDQRLAELACLLASSSLADAYRATLRREADALLDKRVLLRAPELIDAG